MISGPSGIATPVISNRTATSFIVSWMAPTSPNGIITRYSIVLVGPDGMQSASFGASIRQALISDGPSISLDPATGYGLHIEACTAVGCGSSLQITAITLEAGKGRAASHNIK